MRFSKAFIATLNEQIQKAQKLPVAVNVSGEQGVKGGQGEEKEMGEEKDNEQAGQRFPLG